MNLASLAAHAWRQVRTKLAMGGVHDPLHQLSSLHALLDVVENMAMESKSGEGAGAIQHLFYDLYKPDEQEVQKLRETVDTDGDFDAFAAIGMQ